MFFLLVHCGFFEFTTSTSNDIIDINRLERQQCSNNDAVPWDELRELSWNFAIQYHEDDEFKSLIKEHAETVHSFYEFFVDVRQRYSVGWRPINVESLKCTLGSVCLIIIFHALVNKTDVADLPLDYSLILNRMQYSPWLHLLLRGWPIFQLLLINAKIYGNSDISEDGVCSAARELLEPASLILHDHQHVETQESQSIVKELIKIEAHIDEAQSYLISKLRRGHFESSFIVHTGLLNELAKCNLYARMNFFLYERGHILSSNDLSFSQKYEILLNPDLRHVEYFLLHITKFTDISAIEDYLIKFLAIIRKEEPTFVQLGRLYSNCLLCRIKRNFGCHKYFGFSTDYKERQLFREIITGDVSLAEYRWMIRMMKKKRNLTVSLESETKCQLTKTINIQKFKGSPLFSKIFLLRVENDNFFYDSPDLLLRRKIELILMTYSIISDIDLQQLTKHMETFQMESYLASSKLIPIFGKYYNSIFSFPGNQSSLLFRNARKDFLILFISKKSPIYETVICELMEKCEDI